MFQRQNATVVLVMGLMLLVYGVITIIFRRRLRDFYSNIIAHIVGALVYGWLMWMWIDIGLLPFKDMITETMLKGLLVITIGLMTLYSLRVVYVRTKLDDSEGLPLAVVFVPIVCSLVAQFSKALIWQYVCVFGFAIMVVLMIVRNYATSSAKLREEYGYDTNYPGEQIRRVFNTLATLLGMAVVTIMSFVYEGPYGNYVLHFLKMLIYRLFGVSELFLDKEYDGEIPSDVLATLSIEATTETQPAGGGSTKPSTEMTMGETVSKQFVTKPESFSPMPVEVVDDEWKVWLSFGAFFLIMLVIVVVMVEMASKSVRKKRGNYTIGDDEFMAWHPGDDEDEGEKPEEEEKAPKRNVLHIVKYKVEEVLDGDKKSRAVRKLYKKEVMGESFIRKVKEAPSDITRKYITDDDKKAAVITDIYEKARYSESGVTKEDVQRFEKSIAEETKEVK